MTRCRPNCLPPGIYYTPERGQSASPFMAYDNAGNLAIKSTHVVPLDTVFLESEKFELNGDGSITTLEGGTLEIVFDATIARSSPGAPFEVEVVIERDGGNDTWVEIDGSRRTIYAATDTLPP